MSISVTCAKCGKVIKAPDSAAGRKGKCPKCGEVLDIPAAPGAAPSPGDTTAADELAKALGAAAASAQKAEAGGQDSAPPPPKAEPVRPKPVTARPVEAAVPQPTPSPRNESDELIAVSPVGVQTPSGLPMRKRSAAAAVYKWQRTVASVARIVGFGVAGLCLLLGIATMLVLATQKMLVPGLAAFVFTLILATMAVMWSLLARHALILLADMSEELRRQQEILDQISQRSD